MENTQNTNPVNNIPVKVLIMCGGKGTRMWPISNVGHPKQFESILGKESMFRQTIERVLRGFSPEDVYIASSVEFAEYLQSQAKEIPAGNFILEPAMRDNLGALALSTAVINKRHPGSVMVILWGADHVVQKVDVFLSALKHAAQLAHDNNVIVHVDTAPSYPSVHNGWIKIGNKLREVDGFSVYEFVRHVEKPNEETAVRFFNDKSYLIHVGYMATKPELLLEYYRKYAPDTFETLEHITGSIDTPDFEETLLTEYPNFEKISVDYGLFEKLPPRSQWELPADFGWIDVGTWELLYHGLPKDENGNVVIGSAHLMDTKNSLIIGKNGSMENSVGIIGLDGMIVVETEGGLLVCPLSQAPKVKKLYEELFEN